VRELSTKNLHTIDKKHAGEIISRLHQAYDIEEKWGSLADLAKKLGTSASVISGWKKRGVPREKLARARIDTGYLENWMESGQGPMYKPTPEPPAHQVRETNGYYSATTRTIADMVEQMDEQTRKDICLSVQKEKLLRDLLRQKESDEKAS
jgi:hypothetical protein